jgi:adenylate kinase
MATPRAILVFGYPGSGKGTQGRILSALPGFHHIAMGDIFRALEKENPLFDRVQKLVRAGDLVSDSLVMELFLDYVKQLRPSRDDILVLDGLPRNKAQVDLLDKHVKVIKVFKLSVYDEALVVSRMKRRAEIEDRPDDASDAVIRHRLDVYRQETEACTQAYPGAVLTRIQANQPVFDVHLDIITALGKMRDIHFR